MHRKDGEYLKLITRYVEAYNFGQGLFSIRGSIIQNFLLWNRYSFNDKTLESNVAYKRLKKVFVCRCMRFIYFYNETKKKIEMYLYHNRYSPSLYAFEIFPMSQTTYEIEQKKRRKRSQITSL